MLEGDIRPNGNMTVADFWTKVYLPYIVESKEPATVRSYIRYWNAYLSKFFNHTRTLRGFEPFMGTNFLEDLCTEYAAKQ